VGDWEVKRALALAACVLALAACQPAGSADTRGKKPSAKPTPAATKLTRLSGDGNWNIPAEMELGLWRTVTAVSKACVAYVWGDDLRNQARVKLTGSDLSKKLQVRILPGDAWFQTDRCGGWERVAP
jgi:hypothetical protein